MAKATYESVYGKTFSPEASQLVIFITSLAKRWHWSRDTVRKFLNQLEALGMLSKTRIDRRTLVNMTVDCAMTDIRPPMEQLRFHSRCRSNLLSRWMNG